MKVKQQKDTLCDHKSFSIRRFIKLQDWKDKQIKKIL